MNLQYPGFDSPLLADTSTSSAFNGKDLTLTGEWQPAGALFPSASILNNHDAHGSVVCRDGTFVVIYSLQSGYSSSGPACSPPADLVAGTVVTFEGQVTGGDVAGTTGRFNEFQSCTSFTVYSGVQRPPPASPPPPAAAPLARTRTTAGL